MDPARVASAQREKIGELVGYDNVCLFCLNYYLSRYFAA